MNPEKVIGLLFAVLVLSGIAYLLGQSRSSEKITEGKESKMSYAEIVNPSGFVNTEPIRLADLVGKKVILLEFLTYSCINCQRTFPFTNAWYEAYRNEGLEIVGIHTPEFAFERSIENVRDAMKKFGIQFPIVLDNDYDTWRVYGNRYWPRKYLIDIHGKIVYDHIGEGAYEETEKKIQELLRERAKFLNQDSALQSMPLRGKSIAEVKIESQSPETYFGADRNEYLANGKPFQIGEQEFLDPKDPIQLNKLYLKGLWQLLPEHAENKNSGSVIYKYRAKEVYLVAEADQENEIEVFQDGAPVGSQGGESVEGGTVKIRESGLYRLIKNPSLEEHILELRIKKPGLKIFTFTFG